jgi:hypothetical protein
MTTLIRVGNSEGEIGRCDSRCYNAMILECECVCGGLNHKAGEAKAIEQTNALGRTWIDKYAKDKGIDPKELQTEMFGIDSHNQSFFE